MKTGQNINRLSSMRVLCTIAAIIAGSGSAIAQPPAPSTSIAELRQRLDEIERAMQTQVATIRQQIAELEAKPPAAAAQPSATAGTAPAQESTFSRDRESVARVGNRPIDPALQGFVAIPGTPSRFKIDGYAKLDTIIDARPAGNSDQFVPSSIPIGLTDAQRIASTTMHVRQTRLNVDFRSPTDFGGDFRTYAEIDFFGASGSVDPRMRHFYGQVMNVLVGQTWTTFTDPDAYPDLLDITGPVGSTLLRQAQVRYTQPLGGRQSLAFAIERPLTQAPPTEGGGGYSPAPDVIARYRLDRDGSHLQVGSVVRFLGYRVAARNTTTVGGGINVSGAWKATSRDLVIGYAAFGSGIARYIDNTAGQNADLDRNDAGTGVATLPALGTYAALTHQWPHRFRSTAVVGYSGIDNSPGQSASAYQDTKYFAANLLWNPIGSLDIGVEYLFGTHRLKSGVDAQASRLQFAAKYDFFRKRALAP